MKQSLRRAVSLLCVLAMCLSLLPGTALAAINPSSAILQVKINVRAYNPNTQQHERFSNLTVSRTVKVYEGENPRYPVSYRFVKETYWGSTSHPYFGKEGYKLIVTIGDEDIDTANAWVFDRDMSQVSGTGQTFYPMYSPSGSDTFTNTLYISATGIPITPDYPSEDTIKEMLQNAVTVDCVTDGADHSDGTYGLIEGGYTWPTAVTGSADSGWKWVITLNPATYAAQYSKDIGTEHTLEPAGQTGSITLTWDENDGWTLPVSGLPVVFEVECELPAADYTVTIQPANITIYTGGDVYGGVTDANGNIIEDASGLPEPGYHLDLSDDVIAWLNEKINNEGEEDGPRILADYLTFTYDVGGVSRVWELVYMGVYETDVETG